MREAAIITICTCDLAINGGGCGYRHTYRYRILTHKSQYYSSILYIIIIYVNVSDAIRRRH